MRRMFSEKQIGEVAQEQLQDKDLKVKTIEQSQANKVFDMSLYVSGSLTHTPRYEKAFVINNILYMVLSYVMTNETEATIGSTTMGFDFVVDSEVGDKIICTNGEKVSADFTANALVCGFPAFRGSILSSTNNGSIYKVAKNKLRIVMFTNQNINAGDSLEFEGRSFISLLP